MVFNKKGSRTVLRKELRSAKCGHAVNLFLC